MPAAHHNASAGRRVRIAPRPEAGGMLMFITDVNRSASMSRRPEFTETFYWDLNDQTRRVLEALHGALQEEPPTMVRPASIRRYPLLQSTGALAAIRMTARRGRQDKSCRPHPLSQGSIRADGRKSIPPICSNEEQPRIRNIRGLLPAGRDHPRDEAGCRSKRASAAGEEELSTVHSGLAKRDPESIEPQTRGEMDSGSRYAAPDEKTSSRLCI